MDDKKSKCLLMSQNKKIFLIHKTKVAHLQVKTLEIIIDKQTNLFNCSLNYAISNLDELV